MHRAAAVLLVLLSACSRGESTSAFPVTFRTLSEQQNATFCVEGPEAAVALTEDEWISVFDMQTECQPTGDVHLPDVDFDEEVGVAVWWRVEGCLGAAVTTNTVMVTSGVVTVNATSPPRPSGSMCATARGGLESFLAIERGGLYGFDGTQELRFVLNGDEVYRLPAG